MMKATMNDNLTYQEDFLDEMINVLIYINKGI